MEIGAGDGWLMLQIARRLSPSWSGTRVRLVDKQPVPTERNGPGFARLGWHSETLQADVLHIFEDENWNGGSEAIVANLFLHHFSDDQLHRLFRQVAPCTQVFIAVEPRRSMAALAASRLVGVIGCNRITRHDAPVSVRAGFSGRELSLMWPAGPEWALEERRAGCFSHLFVAHRPARTQR